MNDDERTLQASQVPRAVGDRLVVEGSEVNEAASTATTTMDDLYNVASGSAHEASAVRQPSPMNDLDDATYNAHDKVEIGRLGVELDRAAIVAIIVVVVVKFIIVAVIKVGTLALKVVGRDVLEELRRDHLYTANGTSTSIPSIERSVRASERGSRTSAEEGRAREEVGRQQVLVGRVALALLADLDVELVVVLHDGDGLKVVHEVETEALATRVHAQREWQLVQQAGGAARRHDAGAGRGLEHRRTSCVRATSQRQQHDQCDGHCDMNG